MVDEIHDEQPRKRIRLADPGLDHDMLMNAEILAPETKRIAKEAALDDDDSQKEIRAGITAFVSPDLPGFSGVLKQRYTDFLVNEILPSGEVLHLVDTVGAQGYKKEDRELAPLKKTAAPKTPEVPELKIGDGEQITHTEVKPAEVEVPARSLSFKSNVL
jgi:tRNA pseudouridine13 synthase